MITYIMVIESSERAKTHSHFATHISHLAYNLITFHRKYIEDLLKYRL